MNPSPSITTITSTLRRGTLCPKIEDQWLEIKKISEKQKATLAELKTFINGLRDSGDYSGIRYTNTFRVNFPIELRGLGFFGPHEVEAAFYDAFVQIQQLSRNDILFSEGFYRVSAQKGKIFHVLFDRPFIAEPYTFYNIKFQLNGPKTGICDPKTLLNECLGDTVDGRRIHFEFLRGSLQMPEILYLAI